VGYDICCLGTFQVRHNGAPTSAVRGVKVQALLAYLAVESDRPHSRSLLAGLLWPELPEADALRNLTQSLVRVRAGFADGTDPVLADRTSMQWRADVATVDVGEFARLAGSADLADLERAAALYQAELLAGFGLPGCEAFEHWLLLKRETLREQALTVLQTVTERYLAAGRAAEAVAAAGRQLALDPWREAAYRQLMCAHALNGDRAAALAAYARCAETLRNDLGVTPDGETAQLAERIRVGAAALRVAPAARESMRHHTHNLPATLAPLVGREEELARLLGLPDSSSRLATIVGAGGVGKTRLALEGAWAMQSRFTDGVWWVPLAGVQPGADPALQVATVAGAIAAALDLIMDGQRAPLEALAEHVRTRTMLLILDNCEHLPEAGTIARVLLRAAPDLRILATSREPLGISGEALLRLGGLSVPNAESSDPASHAGVRLFLDHAGRRMPGWGRNAQDLNGAIRLCGLLDGLPLGIELAAHWVDHYSTDEIAAALQSDLDSLAARTRDIPDRHRSLRAVFEHSWRLLSEEEQRALMRLVVFQGSFDRAAAQDVAATRAGILVRLVDRSLLGQSGTGRYAMHELLRHFAAERLASDPEAAALARRHAEYYIALAEQSAIELYGAGRASWIPRLESEHDNLRAALAWAREQPNGDAEIRLAGALGRFWLLRGYIGEGREWVERALARPDLERAPLSVRALLYRASGMLWNAQGDRKHGDRFFEQSVALYQAAGDTAGEVNSLILLAGIAYDYGEFSRAIEIWERCVRLARQIEYPEALSRALGNLGAAWYYLGDLERTAAAEMEALTVAENAGMTNSVGPLYSNLGNVSNRQGETERATAYLREALTLNLAMNDPRQIAVALERFAAVAVTEQRMERAARLLGAANRIRTRLGAIAATAESVEAEQTASAGRLALGQATWDRVFTEGAALSLEDTVAYARDDDCGSSRPG